MPRSYSTGGQCECFCFSQILDLTVTVIGKFSQPQPFIANQTPQSHTKGSRHNLSPLNMRRTPELRLLFDDYLYFLAVTHIFTSCNNYMLWLFIVFVLNHLDGWYAKAPWDPRKVLYTPSIIESLSAPWPPESHKITTTLTLMIFLCGRTKWGKELWVK